MPAKAVAGAADLDALLMHGDVVPVTEFGADAVERGAVAREELAQCLVGEHHAEAERVVGLVLLDDLDVPIGAALLGQQGEIQAAGSATDHRDLHAHSRRLRAAAMLLPRNVLSVNYFHSEGDIAVRAIRTAICLLAASVLSGYGLSAQTPALRVGLMFTLSGPAAVLGEQGRNGFMLALDDLGGKLGGMETNGHHGR